MTLIIEDGSIVPNANSVVTDAEYVAYASSRGKEIGSDATAREIELMLAMDYLKSLECRMKGTRVESTQSLPEPRQNVWLYGDIIASDVVPEQYKTSQIEAGIAVHSQPLLITDTTQGLASFNVDGVYSESYFEGGSWEVVRTDAVDSAIKPLMTSGGLGRAARSL